MNRMMLAALLLGAALPAAAVMPMPPMSTLTEVVAHAVRSDANRARDAYRHPVETLTFFGIKPSMTVVEISPQGGWYTEILAPYLKDHGTFYAAANDPAASAGAAKAVDRFKAKLAANTAFANVKLSAFDKGSFAIAPAGSADMVLTFRNVHNWYIGGFAPDAFKAFYTALKPGGVLGIEEHRLPENRPDAMQDSSGYMKTSTVIKLAQAAGFKLVAKSEINANPKDTADYPQGVWTLPPNYAEGDKDRSRYAAIGESDRMTLKFVK